MEQMEDSSNSSATNLLRYLVLYAAVAGLGYIIVLFVQHRLLERNRLLDRNRVTSRKAQMAKQIGVLSKAAIAFKLAKSWDRAGSTYMELSNCHLKMKRKRGAATAFADAANCYKKTNSKESISCFEQAVNLFLEIGCLPTSARYYEDQGIYGHENIKDDENSVLLVQEIAELYEAEQNFHQAIVYYERAADLFHCEEEKTSANHCRRKIAQFAAQLEDYQKSIEIYEDAARQSLSNNLRKYEVQELLLDAGICELCKGKGDVVAINNALGRYQDLDPTFLGTGEYKLLADLADAIDQENVAMFTDAVNKFESMTFTELDGRRTTLLLRVEEALKEKELADADLS
ncbi:hypothetical protein Vadar_024250 [Vaccinium darrowii]|uniref:Uncharacterized protein n=1 Tax=Vaccinium darrowii TaxID=229202 RepID=A0ACB7XKV8_9ERIC|nr:hypothetical protein Vadar_024250 [Vaccinium darrowii]